MHKIWKTGVALEKPARSSEWRFWHVVNKRLKIYMKEHWKQLLPYKARYNALIANEALLN